MDNTNNTPRQDFSNVDYDEAMRRCEAILPLLREEAPVAEARRGLSPRVEAELHRTGLFRYHQPKAWGGMELPFVAYFDIPEMLARGDCSVGWNMANLSSHHRNLAMWGEQIQREAWSENPDCLIASGIAFFQGKGVPVEGGIRLTGKWSFSSGVDVAQWNMLACRVMDGDTVLDYRYCMVRREEYEILDDWYTLGMRGTGSRSVQCKDVFIADYRTQSMYAAKPGHEFPGLRINTHPCFAVPSSAIGGHCIAGAIIGNAQAAVDEAIAMVKSRSTAYTGAKMRDFQTVQLRIGMAGAKVDAARLLMRHDCLEAEAVYARGDKLTLDAKLRYKRNAVLAVKFANEAVDSLHEMAGANGIYDSAPLQRMFRDAHAAGAHINFSADVHCTPWALHALGGAYQSPTM
jgi:3-hydroxy-9,10-secoandrosta-1,3,5(10)-triene-9,17-dione monooxygenase